MTTMSRTHLRAKKRWNQKGFQYFPLNPLERNSHKLKYKLRPFEPSRHEKYLQWRQEHPLRKKIALDRTNALLRAQRMSETLSEAAQTARFYIEQMGIMSLTMDGQEGYLSWTALYKVFRYVEATNRFPSKEEIDEMLHNPDYLLPVEDLSEINTRRRIQALVALNSYRDSENEDIWSDEVHQTADDEEDF